MTTRVYLLCHGSTAAHRTLSFPMDEPLEPQALARLTGASWCLPDADQVLTSPARSAHQTADVLGLTATIDPALRDCDYGGWAGRRLADVQAHEPAAVAAWLRDPAAEPPGGECVLRLIDRAAGWLDRLAEQQGRVLAVTHAAVTRAVLVSALGARPTSFYRFDIAPLTLTRLNGLAGRWNLAGLAALARCSSRDAARVTPAAARRTYPGRR